MAVARLEELLQSAESVTGDWQVHVYRYPEKVLKVPKTLTEIEHAITDGAIVSDARRKEVPGQARQVSEAYFHGIDVVRASPVPAGLLGNPSFLEDGIYWQDRVAPLGDVLRALAAPSQVAAAAELLDRYVQFNTRLWTYGIYEVTYNFTSNVGINAAGDMVLLDFGELATNRGWIEGELATRRWERAWSYRRDMPAVWRAPYAECAARAFTVEAFDRCWHPIGARSGSGGPHA